MINKIIIYIYQPDQPDPNQNALNGSGYEVIFMDWVENLQIRFYRFGLIKFLNMPNLIRVQPYVPLNNPNLRWGRGKSVSNKNQANIKEATEQAFRRARPNRIKKQHQQRYSYYKHKYNYSNKLWELAQLDLK